MLKFSTRQKREIYSVSSLLLHLLVFVILLLSLNSCTEKETVLPESGCNTFATVKDLRGLDGCGFVLELADGQRLEPVSPTRGWCGTTTEEQKTAFEKFNLRDGQKVKIGYKKVNEVGSICMVGQVVAITCIEEIPAQQTNN
jgi:hypothetical protein